jgi:hypothetical protein
MNTVTFAFEHGSDIDSVETFLREVRTFTGEDSSAVYFRGEPQPTEKLLPSVGRPHFYAGRSTTFNAAQERAMLRRFRRHAYAHFQRVPTEWETLFLARHHGLPTRLLDWTANPLVSLYFAAFYENDEITYRDREAQTATMKLDLDGTVWALQRRSDHDDLDVFDENISPLDVAGVRLVQPFYPSPRMTAQSGLFTLHGDPWSDLVTCAGKPYPSNQLDLAKVKRWRITSRCKTAIIADLDRFAVNSRTLFPDLDGLAKGLWQAEIIGEALKN